VTEGTGDRVQILRFGRAADPENRMRESYRLNGPGWVSDPPRPGDRPAAAMATTWQA
jgi:hypothetical protein